MKGARIIGKTIFLAVIAVVVVSCGGRPDGGGGASPDWSEAGPDRESPALAVEGLEVTRGSILRRIEASGTVRGVQEASVVSEVEGMILAAPFELGDAVAEGDPLVRVEATLAQLQLQEAREAFESAQIDLRAVERRFENGSASQSELTRARSSANGARARLEAAEKTFNDHTIQAPISGLIAGRDPEISRGNYITRGAVVTRIVDLSMVETEIAVGEQELEYLPNNAAATVTIPACGGVPTEARVASIAAGSDPQTGSFPVIVRWENACEQLRSGMTVTVAIEAQDPSPGIIVPDAAIRRHDGNDYVFVAAEGTVEERQIRTGRRLGDRVEVVDGLSVGEVIVTSALSALSDGAGVDVTVRGTTEDLL